MNLKDGKFFPREFKKKIQNKNFEISKTFRNFVNFLF
jgi:hypothetical protein